jgi:hypothetical protein
VLDLDVASWGFGILLLDALAVVYTACFFWFYVRFTRGHKQATERGGEAVRRYNASLRGFPNGFYAKMLGRRPL